MIRKLRQRKARNEKGFTLIELMIVIAIIGILAAIAIPNFMSYRDKAYCSAAETDAHSIECAIADYYSIPSHTTILAADAATAALGLTLSGTNTSTIGGDIDTITISVTDGSGRCPASYTTPHANWTGSVFLKTM